MRIHVYYKTGAGNMGDGWKDEIEANAAYAQFLADEIVADLKNHFGSFVEVGSTVTPENYSGVDSPPNVILEEGECEDYMEIIPEAEKVVESTIHTTWEKFCSGLGEKYWAED